MSAPRAPHYRALQTQRLREMRALSAAAWRES